MWRKGVPGTFFLHRHRRSGHIAGTLVKAHEVAEVARGDGLLLRVRSLEADALRILRRAERAGELRTALFAIREARSTIQLLADTERRRLLDEEQTVSVDELMALMAGITDVILRHVPSRETRVRISDEIRLLAGGSGMDPEPV